VVIESKFEKTDHDHFGNLLMKGQNSSIWHNNPVGA
jgi:hypothetical protein